MLGVLIVDDGSSVLSVQEVDDEDAFRSRRSPDTFYNIPSTVIETTASSCSSANTRSRRSEPSTDLDFDEVPEDSDEEYVPEKPAEKRTKRMKKSRLSRRRDDLEGLSKSDSRKLVLKRQKNKEAAARCRQKKIDTIQSLEEAVKRHTEERLRLEETVVDLKKHVRRLEASLAGHAATCHFYDKGDRPTPPQEPAAKPRRPDTLNILKPRTPTDVLFTPATFASLVDSLRSSPMSLSDFILATPAAGESQASDFKLLNL